MEKKEMRDRVGALIIETPAPSAQQAKAIFAVAEANELGSATIAALEAYIDVAEQKTSREEALRKANDAHRGAQDRGTEAWEKAKAIGDDGLNPIITAVVNLIVETPKPERDQAETILELMKAAEMNADAISGIDAYLSCATETELAGQSKESAKEAVKASKELCKSMWEKDVWSTISRGDLIDYRDAEEPAMTIDKGTSSPIPTNETITIQRYDGDNGVYEVAEIKRGKDAGFFAIYVQPQEGKRRRHGSDAFPDIAQAQSHLDTEADILGLIPLN